jgi:hypothetical protein
MTPEFKEIVYPDGTTVYEAVNIEELNQIGTAADTEPALNFTVEQIAEFVLNQEKNQAREYLSSTDWYAARLAETGTPIPEEILEKRQAARQLLSS